MPTTAKPKPRKITERLGYGVRHNDRFLSTPEPTCIQ